ncbi:MAG: hypothetical protein JRJ59_13510 [Deltaproteobacteria bacterium]|nr:hypothetical protein [Deltaproteobacteria bacterium]
MTIICGQTDGSFTQVVGGPVKAGDLAVVGVKKNPDSTNRRSSRLRF